jgi:hypothetical protein
MKHATILLVLAISAILGSKPLRAEIVIDVGQIAFDTAKPQKERAEQLALAAELLAEAGVSDYSENVIHYALQLDPNNLRAQMMSFRNEMVFLTYEFIFRSRWIGSRLAGKMKAEYDKELAIIKECPSCSRIYSAQHGAPFHTGAEVRDFFKKHFELLNRQIAFADRHQYETIDLQSFAVGYQELTDGSSQECPIRETSPNVFVIENCYNQSIKKVRLDKFDWQAMKYTMITAKFEAVLGLAYSQDELPKILYKISHLTQRQMTLKTMGEMVEQSPSFGRLIDRQSLQQLRSIGHEGAFLVREMARTMKCENGRAVERRLGYQYSDGICSIEEFPFFSGNFERRSKASFTYVLNIVKDYALDPENDVRQYYLTRLDLRPILDGRIENLQNAIPKAYDNCGKPMSMANPTQSGFLPRADFLTLVGSYGGLRRHLGEQIQCTK